MSKGEAPITIGGVGVIAFFVGSLVRLTASRLVGATLINQTNMPLIDSEL